MLVLEGGAVRKARLEDLAEAAYALVQLVPLGKATTYGSLAKVLGTSPRLIGRIMAANENPIIVPCHRVVMSNGSLGGYSMRGGPAFKEKLLRLEGAVFKGSGRLAKGSIIRLEELLASQNQ